MKLITTLSFSILFWSIGISQQIDSRLLQRYTEIQLSNIQLENPEEYALLNYALDNAVYFSDLPKEKSKDLQEISLPNAEPTFINLGLDLKDKNQYFIVREQNKLLVVKSRWVLNEEMKKK